MPDLDPEELSELLSAIPGTKEVIQDYLVRGHGVRVPRSSYESMWDRLEEQLGFKRACDALCELLLATAKPRTRDLLDEADKDGEVELRLNEPKIVELLFDDEGEPTDLGELVLAYRRRKTASARRKPSTRRATRAPRAAAPHGPPTHVRLEAIEEPTGGETRQSAASGTGWRLEHVRASAGTFLQAEPDWSERDLEDRVVENWERIDFGMEKRLILIGRQVRLKDTREKVDLLAKTSDGTRVAIELKIVPATGADLTQLLSYMQDLAFSRVSYDKIQGVLIAPGFAEKVLNAAGADPRLQLMRFLSDR